jgi:hypothetical protein
MHCPPWQISVTRQGLPHPPQLLWSVEVSTHISGVPHIFPAVIDAQGTHLPLSHADKFGQAVPHPPQLA